MTKSRDLANAATALSAVSATELGYVDGVTSAIQTQLDAKLATTTAATTYVANALADAKGDIFVATADNTVTRLPVGNSGEQIVADSSTSTGLRYTGNFAAGKNKIINGDFRFNQRAFSSTTTNNTYGFDRFKLTYSGGTTTMSAQTFTAGTAPVAGYEAKNFLRLVSTSQSAAGDYSAHRQSIEDVRSFAGQTVTVSLWAKASTGTPNLGVTLAQNFGSGGSSTVPTSAAVQAITTSWARYSFTIAVPSVSGKTIDNADSSLDAWVFISAGSTLSGLGYAATGIQNVTIDTWGVQVEAGSVATAFQTATGTLQGELAACQRYYVRFANGGTYNRYALGSAISTTAADVVVSLPVTMRTSPSSVDYSTLLFDSGATGYTFTALTLDSLSKGPNSGALNGTGLTGLTQFRPLWLANNNSTSSYVGFSAEL